MIANYHTHTWRCNHAMGLEEDYVKAALDQGLQILGFADHTPYFFPGDYYSTYRMLPEELRGEYAPLLTEAEETAVFFRAATQEELLSYIRSGEPMDKAGGYGIQGLGSLLVEKIDGDFFNVMGLPLLRLSRMLAQFGVKLL